MKDNHIKQSPVLALLSLGGGSHSSYVYKAGDTGGGGGGGGGGGSPGAQYTPDGTAIYAMHADNVVRRHNMSTAFDITTMSYNSASSPLETTSAGPCRGIQFSGDGYKLFYVFYSNSSPYDSTVKTKSLSTPWDITTISDASETFTFTSDLTNIGGSQGLTFKHDGTKMYLIDAASSADGYIMEYNLSTAWDVSTASYVAKNSAGKFQGFGPGYLRGATFNDDGTILYTCNASNTYVYRWPLTTAWDITTLGNGNMSTYYQATRTMDSPGTNLLWKHDGTKYFLVGIQDEVIHQLEPSNAWMNSGAQYDNPGNGATYSDYWVPFKKAGISSQFTYKFGDSGNYFYVTNGYSIKRYNCSTPYDPTSVSTSGQQSVSYSPNIGYGPRDICWNSTGTSYLVGPETQFKWVKKFDLSTAWDLTTQQEDTSAYLDLQANSSGIGNPNGGCISDDGKHVYAVQYGQSKVWQWTMSTPFDLSTASYTAVGTNFTQAWAGCKISPNGTQLITWYSDNQEETFRSYTLSTAYDVTSATFDKSFNTMDDLQGVPSPINKSGWVIQGGRWIMIPYYGYASWIIRFGSGAGSDWPFNLDNAEFTGTSPHYQFHAQVNSNTRGSFLK